METVRVSNGEIELAVRIQGVGPTVLCVHGFPELWYSWRHQMSHFAARGYQVAAMDVRGYGGSSRPRGAEAYGMRSLASDVVAVARAVADGPVILFGHDWGAPLVYATALLYPKDIRAVAGLSVPYVPQREAQFIDVMKSIYADRFFYQLYFQKEGVAETELETDVSMSLRKVYYALAGDAPAGEWLKPKPKDAGLLDDLVDPRPFPAWLSADDLEVYVAAFRESGFRGALNRYRAQSLDHAQLAETRDAKLAQPCCFIGGSKDAVRGFLPGKDLFDVAGDECLDFRGKTILSGAGHWVQQEAPAETNEALQAFLETL